MLNPFKEVTTFRSESLPLLPRLSVSPLPPTQPIRRQNLAARKRPSSLSKPRADHCETAARGGWATQSNKCLLARRCLAGPGHQFPVPPPALRHRVSRGPEAPSRLDGGGKGRGRRERARGRWGGGRVFDLLGDQKLKWHQLDGSISIAIFSLRRNLKIQTTAT